MFISFFTPAYSFLCYNKCMNKQNFYFLIDNIEVIKANYEGYLSPFFDKEIIIKYKTFVYSYNVAEWKKDKVWEYLNGDIIPEVFIEIVKHIKK